MTTQTVTTTELTCDAAACRERIVVEGNDEAAWKAAADKGWSYDTDNHDWCPWHTDPDRRLSCPH